MDNITQQVTEQGTHDYIYDLINRLTNATHASLPDEAYTYDAIGNRLTDSRDAGPWSYNANNQLTANPGASFDYDANGSLIEKTEGGDTFQYDYNLENRMAGVDGPTDASYYYDPFGRRLWKQVGGVKTYFHYTDWGLAGEYQGSSQASVAQVQGYGFLPQGLWSMDPAYTRRSGQYYYYLNDHLGTPQKLIDSSGAVKWSADYEVFGRTRNESGAIPNPLRFPGQYEDVETGTYYNYFRDYDPGVGRYLQTDPIGLRGGVNTYGYVLQNPHRWSDPVGLAINWNMDYNNPEDFLQQIFVDWFGPEDEINNWIHRTGTAIIDCIFCEADCMFPVLVNEAVAFEMAKEIDIAKKAAETAARAKKLGRIAMTFRGVSGIGTAIGVVSCSVKCSYVCSSCR